MNVVIYRRRRVVDEKSCKIKAKTATIDYINVIMHLFMLNICHTHTRTRTYERRDVFVKSTRSTLCMECVCNKITHTSYFIRIWSHKMMSGEIIIVYCLWAVSAFFELIKTIVWILLEKIHTHLHRVLVHALEALPKNNFFFIQKSFKNSIEFLLENIQ